MIGYDHIPGPDGGIYAPLIVCDSCGTRITGAGNTYWLADITTGDVLPGLWHTHKSHCANLDQALGDHNTIVMSEELRTWLRQLAENAASRDSRAT